MTKMLELYKCNICGNIVEVIHPGSCSLTCCSVPMEHLCENTNDENFAEKHVPVVSVECNNKTIRIGSLPHPMEKEHYIVFIESISADKKYLKRKYLFPGDKPEAEFKYETEPDSAIARELCNIHGLWTDKLTNKDEKEV